MIQKVVFIGFTIYCLQDQPIMETADIYGFRILMEEMSTGQNLSTVNHLMKNFVTDCILNSHLELPIVLSNYVDLVYKNEIALYIRILTVFILLFI